MDTSSEKPTYLNKNIEGVCVGPFGLHFKKQPSLWIRFILRIMGFEKWKDNDAVK